VSRSAGRRRAGWAGAAVITVAPLLAGCSGDTAATIGGLPQCTPRSGTVSAGVVVLAQAVPTARWLPCVRAVPTGWGFGELHPRDGSAMFWLNAGAAGQRALVVLLRPACDTAGGAEAPSEEPGMRRYDGSVRMDQGYRGERHYVFDGGCVTYQFDLRGASAAQPLAPLTAAMGFVSRAELARLVHDTSDGRLRLDAQPGAR
jgi:hypothetical protein